MPIRAVGGLGHSVDEALQRHVQRLPLDPERLGGKRSSCSASTPTPILSAVLPIRIRRRDRAIDQRRDPTDSGNARERAAEGADAGAQQLRLAAQALQPARGALAAVSMRFRLCSPLWPTEISSALTWPPPSTARRIACSVIAHRRSSSP